MDQLAREHVAGVVVRIHVTDFVGHSRHGNTGSRLITQFGDGIASKANPTCFSRRAEQLLHEVPPLFDQIPIAGEMRIGP